MEPTNGFFVYYYHHDDDGQGWTPLQDFRYRNYVREDVEKEALSPDFIEKLASALKEFGWEGDGALEAMMVPPFFTAGGDNYWFPVFHVKQENNGTSWIASEYQLSVEDLNAQSPNKKRK